MRDTWGAPGGGWPAFDKDGKRIREDLLDRAFGPANESYVKAGTAELLAQADGPATDECDEELGL